MDLKKTPLYDCHIKAGARMVPFISTVSGITLKAVPAWMLVKLRTARS